MLKHCKYENGPVPSVALAKMGVSRDSNGFIPNFVVAMAIFSMRQNTQLGLNLIKKYPKGS